MTQRSSIKQRAGLLVLILAFGIVLGASGCGDEDNGGASAGGTGSAASEPGVGGDGESQSKTQFIEEADAICQKVNAKTGLEVENLYDGEGAASNPSASNPNKLYEEAVLDLIVPQVEREVSEISALDIPAGAEKAAETLISNLEGIIEAAKADPAGFATGEVSSVNRSEDQARKLGFKACGPLA